MRYAELSLLLAPLLTLGCAGHRPPPVVLSPLNAAVAAGSLAGVRSVLDSDPDADPGATDADGRSALDRASMARGDDRTVLGIVDLLLERCEAVYVEGRNCAGALSLAANYGRDRVVKVLLDKGASVDGKYRSWETPLLHAAMGMYGLEDPRQEFPGHVEAARLLLERGARFDTLSFNGNPPLYFAIAHNRIGVAKLLLAHGANPNAKDSQGKPLLLNALWDNKLEFVRELMLKGADPEPAIADLERSAAYYENLLATSGGTIERNQLNAVKAAIRTLERLGRPSSPSPAAGAVSKDELSSMVQAAVEKAVPKPAAPREFRSEVDRPGYRLAERPDDYALVVGIGKYSDIPEAQFAERDAEAVKEHLIAAGFPSRNVIRLFGEKAGRSSMEKFLETWLPRNVSENSRVFFYFSGHGAPDPKTGEAYLIPWDGDPGFLENTGYPVRRLYEKLSALKAKEVIVAMDACFSGAGGRSVLPKGARPLVMSVDAATVPQNLSVFAAASGDQITSTLEDQGHGTFTYYFLKGLSGGAKDSSGRVSAKALHDYLKPKVQDAARRQNRDQEPVLHGSGDKELVRF